MDEPRKRREGLTHVELGRLKEFGAIEFKSIRGLDMRVEPIVASRTQH
jgi:hypothetical protein